MSKSAIEWTVSKQLILVLDVSDVGETGRHEDLNEFHKSLWPGNWVRASLKMASLVPGQQWSKEGQAMTGDRGLGY